MKDKSVDGRISERGTDSEKSSATDNLEKLHHGNDGGQQSPVAKTISLQPVYKKQIRKQIAERQEKYKKKQQLSSISYKVWNNEENVKDKLIKLRTSYLEKYESAKKTIPTLPNFKGIDVNKEISRWKNKQGKYEIPTEEAWRVRALFQMSKMQEEYEKKERKGSEKMSFVAGRMKICH